MRCLRQWTLPEYAEKVIARLRPLEAREPAPKILPKVIQAWRQLTF